MDRLSALTSREGLGTRQSLIVLGFLGLAVELWQCATLSNAMLLMTSHPDHDSRSSYISIRTQDFVEPDDSTEGANGTSLTEGDAVSTNASPFIYITEGQFNWNVQMQEMLFGAYFWGFAIGSLFGGRMAEYHGGKLVFGIGITVSSVLSIVSPACAMVSGYLLMVCRILMGIAQGVTCPAITTLLATWVLPGERTLYTTSIFSGMHIGTALGLSSGSLFHGLPVVGSWQMMFYVSGVAGLLWCMVWRAIIYERPEQHPRIIPLEIISIQEHRQYTRRAEVVPIQWKTLSRSLPFWSVMIGALGKDYGLYSILNHLPAYFYKELHFDLRNSGLMACLPYLLMFIFSLVWMMVMHHFSISDKMSILTVRRLSMAVALYGPVLGGVITCAVGKKSVVSFAMLCLSMALRGAINCGYFCSHQDLAPNISGSFMGASNAFGALPAVAEQIVSSFFIDQNDHAWAWRGMLLVGIVLCIVSGSCYIVYFEPVIQEWNLPPPMPDHEPDFFVEISGGAAPPTWPRAEYQEYEELPAKTED